MTKKVRQKGVMHKAEDALIEIAAESCALLSDRVRILESSVLRAEKCPADKFSGASVDLAADLMESGRDVVAMWSLWRNAMAGLVYFPRTGGRRK